MGGPVPLGYSNCDRKLHIVEKEAQTVRRLFDLYLQYKNIRLVKTSADELGLVSKRRFQKSDNQTGGTPLSRGHIQTILNNPLYVGKIRHKNNTYQGNHEPIVPTNTWGQVQFILKGKPVKRTTTFNAKSPALLTGLLFDGEGSKLVPHHANKKGTRYHYYVSCKLRDGDQDTGRRIPFRTIEPLIQTTLIQVFKSKSKTLKLLPIEFKTASEHQTVIRQAKQISLDLQNADQQTLQSFYKNLIETITLEPTAISFKFNRQFLENRLKIQIPSDAKITLVEPMTVRRRGHEMKMVIGEHPQQASNLDPALIRLIAKAHLLRIELETAKVHSIKEFALAHNMDNADAKRLLPLGFLAPDIVEAILLGQQPLDLTMQALKNGYKLPMLWSDQRVQLGFPV